MELLTIDEFRKQVLTFQQKETGGTQKVARSEDLNLNTILSPVTKQSKENLETIIRMLPGYNDEEKEMITEAFEDGFKLVADDCIQYGIRIGSAKTLEV